MKPEFQIELESAIKSNLPLRELVSLLRQFKEKGIAQQEVYTFLEALRKGVPDEVTDDRILEVADLVAGFCTPQWRIWDGSPSDRTAGDDDPPARSRAS